MRTLSMPRSVSIMAIAGALAAGCGPASAESLHETILTTQVVASPSGPGMLPAGQAAGRSAVPWRLVGPGWTLAVVGTATSAYPQVLLIDPLGGTYRIFRWPTTLNPRYVELLDWSGDGRRALLRVPAGGPNASLDQLTLRTGTLTFAPLSTNLFPLAYTRPLGLQVLALDEGASAEHIVRISTSGRLVARLAPRHAFGNAVMSPNGQVVAAGTPRQVAFVSNAGGVIRETAIPGANPAYGCFAVRWWNATNVLTRCGNRIWLVPSGGGAATAITGRQTQLVDAWQAGAHLYVSAFLSPVTYPNCDVGLERQEANGSLVVIKVPGLGCASGAVLASVRGRLLLLGQPDHASGSLRWYDPANGRSQILYQRQPGASGITSVASFGYGEQDQLFTS